MSKQLNVSLAFTANTSEAIAQIKNLQKELNNISMGKFDINSPIRSLTPEIQSAMKAASQLQAALENAVNVQTGKLDLGKFQQSLKMNQKELSDYARQLSALGPAGNKAFLQLANSISQAEMPLIRSNNLLKELGTTLANTARWQLSSSLLHGFMGSIQKAYGYAKDLNESLNNIRIVTGQSIERMSKFAEEANKAARALGTTTTEYTNASLIYYQQGLSDQQVKERTDITIKMANVARQSAEVVSDQMTAVWNNFYDGSKSLEHYADVMTALGAATASSTDEIAQGLNKFAAVADTVGLSYEYAASALATVTATTRESADVVGTAFKTLFARIEGLSLGETLDDGTNLNKYSEALYKIGINIKDTNGNMKNMDTILNELGRRWKTLGKDQQIAVAQTVAGVRQYTQLVALMDNWDFMQDNLQVVENSGGALAKQAKTYEESWEAASKKVKSSLENIYKALLNDEFFIDLTNFASKLIDIINTVIDSFGGVKGILLTIGSLLTKIFHDDIAKAMNSFGHAIKRLTPSGRQREQNIKNAAWDTAAQLRSNTIGNEKKAETVALSQEVSLQRKLLENADRLSEEEIKQYQIRMDSIRAIQDQAKEQAKIADAAKKSTENLKDEMRIRAKMQASTKARTETKAKIEQEISSDREEVSAQHTKQQEDYRSKREQAIRANAEVELKKHTPKTQQVGTKFAEELKQAGDAAIQESAAMLDQEIQDLANKQAEEYAATLAKRMEQAKGRIDEAAQAASQQAGEDVESHTKVMENLGTTKGVGKRLQKQTSDRVTQGAKSTEDTRFIAKDALKDVQQLKKQINDLKKDGVVIIQDKELDKLEGLEKTLQALLDDPNTDARKLQQILRDINDEAVNINVATDNAIIQAASAAETDASVSMDNTDYLAIAQAAEAAEEKQAQFNNTLRSGEEVYQDLGNDIDGAGMRMLSLTDKITYGSQAIMSFGMALSSVQGMIDTAFDPDVSGMEKIIAIMTTLGMMIPTISSAYEAYTKIFQQNTVAAGANAAAQSASAGATSTMTAATTAQTPAVQANSAVWWIHPIIAIIAAACLAAVAAFGIFNNIMKQNSEITAKNAAKAREEAAAAREQAEANNELLKSYQEALIIYKETGENKEALIDVALKAAEAYDIEGAALDLLTGKYDQLNKKLIEKRKKEIQDTKNKNKSAITATTKELADALRKGDGHKTSSGEYKGTFGGGMSSSDETAALRTMDLEQYQFLKKDGSSVSFAVDDITNAEDMYQYYTELDQWIKSQQKYAEDNNINLGASEIYNAALEELEQGAEQYAQLKEIRDSNKALDIEQAAYDTTITSGNQQKGITDIETVQEYRKYEQAFLDNYTQSLKKDGISEKSAEYEELISQAKEYLATFSNISDLQLQNAGFEDLSQNADIEEIEQFYNTLSAEEQDIFWTIGVDEYTSIDYVKSYMQYAQGYLDTNKALMSIGVKEEALEAFKTGNFQKLKELWKDGQYDMEFLDFLQLSTEEAERYLTNSQVDFDKIIAENEKELEASRQAAQQKVNDAENAVAQATAKNDAAEWSYNFAQRHENAAEEQAIDYFDWSDSNDFYGLNYKQEGVGAYDTSVVPTGIGGLEGFMARVISDSHYGKVHSASFIADWEALIQARNSLSDGTTASSDAYVQQMNNFVNSLIPLLQTNSRYSEMSEDDLALDLTNTLHDALFLYNNEEYNNKASAQFLIDAWIAAADKHGKDQIQSTKTQYDKATNNLREEQKKLDEARGELKSGSTSEQALENIHATNLEIEQEFNNSASAMGVSADEARALVKELPNLVDNYKELDKSLLTNEKVQRRVALAIKQTKKGFDNLTDGFSDWEEAIKGDDTLAAAEAIVEMKIALSDVMNITDDLDRAGLVLGDHFGNYLIENMETVRAAADGDRDAILELQKVATKDIMLQLGIDEENNTLLYTQVNDMMDVIQTMFDNESLKIGAVDDVALLQSLEGIVNACASTSDEAQALLATMGFDAKVSPVETTMGTTHTYPTLKVDSDQYGYPIISEGEPIVLQDTMSGQVGAALQIETANYVGGGNISTKSGGTGRLEKNSKSTPAKPINKTKKSDVVERYKEVTDKIDDVQNAMNDASKAADRLWGPARLKQLEKQNKLIQDEVKLLKQKKKEAQANLIKDRSDLSKAAAAAGVSFNIDEKGNITNYTEKMDALYAELESRENEADGFAKEGKSKEEQDEYIEKYVTPLQDKINELKEAMSQYEETRELLEDIDDQIDDKWNEWQDNNYEQLTYKLELKIEINDRDLEEIEYYLNKAADDFYQMAESAALLVWGNSELNPGKSKLDVYKENYETDNDHLNDLNNQYNTFNEDGIRNISQKDYAAGLKEIHSNALADAQALKEIDDTMLDYYGNTLAMAGEELAKYTDRMEHQTAVLEHYRSIMDIIGKSTDYESMGVILEGQAKTIENELAVAQGNYEMLAGEADYWKQMMDSVDETDPAFAVYKANWEAAESAAREAQDNMLAKTEEWAEAMKAVLENKLAGLAQTLENALTGGTSFDTITTQMERAASLQEEYLTTTNKIYETNKMINTAQQAIDKTTNTVAKQKLKSFQQETAQLQSKKKLSQYELEIQQAKYDLLLAEIALEEAQQAKSTVRLQRDSEGNFGYIYTADANELADAEQKLADAQNNLYNIGLEGANNYVQKYQETMREMYDTLTDIQTRYLNGEFESEEEYHQAMEEAKEYYYQKLQDYSSLYQVSLTTDSRVVKDAWSTDFAGMTQNTESWKTSVNRYVGEVEQAFKQWDQTVQSIKNQTVGKNLDELNTKVGNIVTESNNLTTAITKDGGLLDALQSEITEVGNVALKYASLRGEVQGLILEYQKLAEEAKKTYNSIDFEENDDDKDDTPPGVKGTVGGDEDLSDVGVDKDTDGFDDFDNRIEETSTTYLTSDSSPVTVYTNLGRGTSTKIAGNRLYHKGTISPNTTQYSGYTFYEVFYDQAGIAYPGYLLRKDYADLKQKASSFDTGGYTGSWGSEGKMAMLHEKELILNANDTTNFLASLEVLREIVNTINLHSMNAQLGGLLSTPHWTGADQSQILEQQVHIEASFPGVQDRNEIEEAFNNLINRASQFVNRK